MNGVILYVAGDGKSGKSAEDIVKSYFLPNPSPTPFDFYHSTNLVDGKYLLAPGIPLSYTYFLSAYREVKLTTLASDFIC